MSGVASVSSLNQLKPRTSSTIKIFLYFSVYFIKNMNYDEKRSRLLKTKNLAPESFLALIGLFSAFLASLIMGFDFSASF